MSGFDANLARDLLPKLQAATKGSRYLDRAMFSAMGWQRSPGWPTRWARPADLADCLWEIITPTRNTDDAARLLSADYCWFLGKPGGDKFYWAEAQLPKEISTVYGQKGATPALALCIAILALGLFRAARSGKPKASAP